jgi:hypothetical protein
LFFVGYAKRHVVIITSLVSDQAEALRLAQKLGNAANVVLIGYKLMA